MTKKRIREINAEIQKIQDEWEKAGISNSFIFGKIMTSRPDLLLELLQYSLPEMQICSIHDTRKEDDIRLSIDAHGVRLDVSARDNTGRTIDVEMQMKDEKNIPRRMRYYSGAIDQTILEKGMNYSSLTDTVVLFITLFDPFGRDFIRYTFRNICIEDKELELEDGTTKIVLNAVGTKGNTSKELKDFLNLVSGSFTYEKGSFADRIQDEVAIARKNSDWRRQYMEWKMTLLNERNKGREEGLAEGIERGRVEGLKEGRAEGLEEGRSEGVFETLCTLVKDGILTVKDAAERAGISEEDFKEKMRATPHA